MALLHVAFVCVILLTSSVFALTPRKYSLSILTRLQWRAPLWSVVVSTTRHQSVQSLAFLQAEWLPMLTDRTSPIAVSQLVRERPQDWAVGATPQ